MYFNLSFLATALLVCASPAMSATVIAFAGADCTGAELGSGSGGSGTCLTEGSASARSYSYSGVTNQIQFFQSGGQNDNCKGTPFATRGAGSGCVTAPTGVNIESARLT
ncbi:hypothetical protein GGX14DRAFT_170820 [Mycena pura]|uniref:Secreted protein n=1 Tax=Mycena pura TaxID=153505 RepID=A0AAD6Y720_9AGAR|nr:hypothetical protein GGX14DRAFT_170820 [Mycena pura]